MIGAGHLIGHRDWAPDRKTDPGPFLVDQIRDWAPDAAPTEEDDVSKQDVVEALREVLHLPATGLAVPKGLAHNGDLYARLLDLDRAGFNADSALRTAIAAVQADDRLDDAATARMQADLKELLARIPAVPIQPTPPPTTTTTGTARPFTTGGTP